MSFLFGSGGGSGAKANATTKGQFFLAKGSKLLEERKARMESSTAFPATFVDDVFTIVDREITRHPHRKSFTLAYLDVLNDATLYSKKFFAYVCGSTSTAMLYPNEVAILQKALYDASIGQDFSVYGNDISITLDFTSVDSLVGNACGFAE